MKKELTQSEFNKLSTEDRFNWLKEHAQFIANRKFGGHFVSLFTVDGLFIEMYKRIDIHTIDYIEIQKNTGILQSYGVDLNKYLL